MTVEGECTLKAPDILILDQAVYQDTTKYYKMDLEKFIHMGNDFIKHAGVPAVQVESEDERIEKLLDFCFDYLTYDYLSEYEIYQVLGNVKKTDACLYTRFLRCLRKKLFAFPHAETKRYMTLLYIVFKKKTEEKSVELETAPYDFQEMCLFLSKKARNKREALDIEGEQELLNKTEQAKLTLSKKEETFFTVMTRNGRKEVTVTREEFETCTAHLLAKAMNVLADTKKSLEEKGIFKLDQIVLCGGATRMPQIIAGIKKIYGDINIYEKDVDQAVAKGAAIYASLLNEKQPEIQQNQSKDKGTTGRSGGSDVKAKELRCVTSRSYGILAFVGETEKKISNMIFQNTEVGSASKTVKAYYTKYDNQREVALKIYEDTMSVSHVDKEEGTFLGKCYLKIQGNLPQNSPIKVEMSLDENGTLFIRGSEESGKTEVTAYIETNALLSPDELVKERAQVEDVFVNVE